MSSPNSPRTEGKAAACLELFRVSNLPTVWMNAMAAFLLCGERFSLLKASLLLAAFSMAYCGGMAMNDCMDAGVDAVSRPDRPIPSGRIALSQGRWLCLALLIGAGLCFLAVGSGLAVAAGLVLLILIWLYNLTHKLSAWAIFPMAGCRFMIYIVTGFAFLNALPIPLIALAAMQFSYVLLLTCVARMEKGTTAVEGRRSRVPMLLAGIPVIDGLALAFLVGPGWLAAGVAGGVATAAWQRKTRGD